MCESLRESPGKSGHERATVRCSRCGTENPEPVEGVKRSHTCSQCHAFLPGNSNRLRHGFRRVQKGGTLPEDLRQSVEDFRAQVISDQGGLGDLSAVRAGLVRLLVGAETLFRVAYAELHRQGGVSTPSGRLAFDRCITATQTWTRVAEKLGIDRRPKDATQDIRDWWAQNSQPLVTADAQGAEE